MGKSKGNTLEGSRHVAPLRVKHHSCVSRACHQRHAQTKTDRQTDRGMDADRDNSTRCLSLFAKQTNAYHHSTAARRWANA